MLIDVDNKPILKVIDFGTSRKIIQEKYLTAKLGTVIFCSKNSHIIQPPKYLNNNTPKNVIFGHAVSYYILYSVVICHLTEMTQDTPKF